MDIEDNFFLVFPLEQDENRLREASICGQKNYWLSCGNRFSKIGRKGEGQKQ